MMRKVQSKWLITACLAVIVGLALTSTASATVLGTVNVQNHNNSLSNTGTISGGGLSGLYVYTGIYSWTNEGGTDLGTGVPNWGFCIELTQSPYNGWQDVVPLDEAPLPALFGTPMQIAKANYIRELWGRHFDPSWVTNPTTANKQLAEAFGASVWEIVYEQNGSPATWNVSTGSGFRATGIEQAAAANSWLSGLNGDTTYFNWNLAATSTLSGQDYLIQLPTAPPHPPVPEPATIALLGLGALCLLRRKR
ncbi:MAG: PEP-CTERM sorting domain-containing protein [Phycisphaerae bacterium]|jgi:hypothetical protein